MVVSQNFLMLWSDEHFIPFRAKAYNGFNHTNFADPTANINSTFGPRLAVCAALPVLAQQTATRPTIHSTT